MEDRRRQDQAGQGPDRHAGEDQADGGGVYTERGLDCREPWPQAATVTPPTPKPVVIALRQRARAGPSTATVGVVMLPGPLATALPAGAQLSGGAPHPSSHSRPSLPTWPHGPPERAVAGLGQPPAHARPAGPNLEVRAWLSVTAE